MINLLSPLPRLILLISQNAQESQSSQKLKKQSDEKLQTWHNITETFNRYYFDQWQFRAFYSLFQGINYNQFMQAVNPAEGREFSIQDDKGPSALLLRTKKGVFLTPAYAKELQQAHHIFGVASYLLQTRKGNLLVVGSDNKYIIYDLLKRALLLEVDCNYIYSMTLSPGEKYLQVLDKVDANEGKTTIVSLQTLKVVAVFKENAQTNYYVKSSYPLVKFTSEDRLMFRYNSKVIEVYSEDNTQVRVIKTGLQEFFQLSLISTENNYVLVAAFLDKKTNKGCLQLYKNEKQEPYYEKVINKAEEIKIKFSPTSNKFLIELQTYYDPTGKSYYGEYGLYLYNELNNKIVKVKTASGPVHDFSWDRNGENFLVISGFMPAEPVLFSKNNEMVFEFGKQHKNEVLWGNLGRFVCLGGFGNLNGEMQIWDIPLKKRIGICKSNSASYCAWSSDDRKIITAILTPRLRVDNCYRVFSYTGVLLHKANYDHTELYQAVWLKDVNFSQKDARGLSPGRKSGGEVKVEQKFKSFAASLNFDSLSNNFAAKNEEKPQLVPGQHPEDPPKKKKRNRPKYEPKLEA